MPSNIGLGNHVENKNELVSHNFDIFSSGSVEKAMSRGYEQEIHTNAAVTSDGPFEFYIPPTADYIFLPHTRLYVRGKISRVDATATAAIDYSIVNLFPHALFRQVDVSISGLNTSSQDFLYPYKAFFETLFSYSDHAKKSHLKGCSGWIVDTPSNQDVIGDGNNGYKERKELVKDGREFDFCVPLHADILQCAKLVPPNTSLKINLSRMNDAFSLMCAAGTEIKIEISHLSLFIRKIIPTEYIRGLYDSTLDKKPVILPFSRSIIKRESIAQNSSNVHLTLFNGELPRQILICFVRSDRLDGRKQLNPFKFDHFSVRYINLRVNGMSEPCKPYEPNFENGRISRELRALYDNTGILTGDTGYGITRSEFLNGLTFFAWDTTADHCNGFHNHEKKMGRSVDLDVAFTTALESPVNILIYATYETSIKLLNGQVIEASFVNG